MGRGLVSRSGFVEWEGDLCLGQGLLSEKGRGNVSFTGQYLGSNHLFLSQKALQERNLVIPDLPEEST